MSWKTYFLLTGIFALVALARALRIYMEWPVMIAHWSVPKSVSWIALIVATGFALVACSPRRMTTEKRRCGRGPRAERNQSCCRARPEAARRRRPCRLEAYHANQIKLRHERKEREAKEAREELARQVAERNRTAGWGNTAGRRVVRAICQVGPVREAGNDRICIWRPCLSNRSVGIHAVF